MGSRLPRPGRLAALLVTAAALALPQAAPAAIDDVFGGDVACSVESDGVRFCGSSSPRSTTKTFDGVPIDVNVAFPPAPAAGADGNYPLIMLFHGYGGGKLGLDAMRRWLERGYATFSMTDRGFRESCGSPASRVADPVGCANGYVHLLDTRYEVRDAQDFAAELADEGLVDPQRIGAIGGSYGGGLSMALAALRDRKMMPDGSLVPWTSEGGKPMRIAAATPNIPWTDLAYSLVPNGSTLDYVADAPYRGRFGVMKRSFVNGLYVSGQAAPGYYAAPGTPGADLTGWFARIEQGEPYDGDPRMQAIFDEITTHHSSYYIDHSVPPAPLLMSSGFTDDLFPVDEVVRFYNRTRSEHPKAPIALFAGDFGHMRGQNKDDVLAALEQRQNAWMDHYVKGGGAAPRQGVEVFTETCPPEAPSGGPFRARSWAQLAPGEIRIADKGEKTIAADAEDDHAVTFDPVSGDGACAKADAADQPGTANYRVAPAPAGGYTLAGSATVIAGFTLPGANSQVAVRLLDVAPDGTEQLVARALWRPAVGGPTRQVFQLHPNAWKFAAGHEAKLELLPADSGGGPLNSYGRASNGQEDVTVADLELRLPVLQRPGSYDGLVTAPAKKVVPKGYALAADFAALREPRGKLTKGKLKVRERKLIARVKCPRAFASCNDGKVAVRAARRGKASKRPGFKVAQRKFGLVKGGKKRKLKLKLTRKARRYFREERRLRVVTKVRSAETERARKQRRNAVARRRRG